ncbi:TIR domain-containing protein [Microbacterium oxydans]|uniref:TIR domain-containing protein n=1 Tax=Microbacterium oxydans TaxID=82380 RepID=A0A0F0LIY0_9MICO|nr:TIR domain-containing protein [Microbacterium oxydans]KJL33108.1 hypothetical protein RS83_00156 [Microbacterium oxydans]
MKVFISWSKPLSHSVAQLFAEWLPKVIQECRGPYVSSDTDKGEAWFQAITTELRESKIGVVFITSQNVHEEWIHLEAGAIYAALDKRLLPILVNIKKADYDGPLRNIQMTELADKTDMLKLVKSINKACDVPLEASVLESTFDTFWPHLQTSIEAVIAKQPPVGPVKKRTMDDKIDEILLQLRGLNQATSTGITAGSKAAQRKAMAKEREQLIREFEAVHGGRFVVDAVGAVVGEIVNVSVDGERIRVRAIDKSAEPQMTTMRVSDMRFSEVPF